MKKTFYYILRIIVSLYAIFNLIMTITGVVLSITEQNASFLFMVFIFVLLFALCIFLDKKLKRKVKNLNNAQGNVSIYVRNKHTISHVDSSSITEEEIPHLIECGYQNALEHENNNSNPKFHRTKRDEELSFNFEYNSKNFDVAKQYINKFENLEQQALNESNFEKKIELFNQSLIAYEKAKKICYRTKGGMIWFQDMYEYLHNSESSCFSYADTIKDYIKYYTEIRLLETQIHTIIEDNNGYLQKDLYKLFPNSSKGYVQRAVKNLVENNIIEKTKQDSTYILTIKGE